MKFDVLLSKFGISREMSIFSQASDELMKFDFPESDNAKSCTVDKEQCLSTQPIAVSMLQQSILEEWEDYRLCCHELECIYRELNKESENTEEIRNNRIRRKQLIKEKNAIENSAGEQAGMRLFGMASLRKTLSWKDLIYATTISSLCTFLPDLNAVSMDCSLRKIPIFTDKVAQWKQRIDEGTEFAVEGGPCLFGADEAAVIIQMKNGLEYTFDFATEVEVEGKMPCLFEFAEQNFGAAERISFEFSKKALTEAEYNSLVYVFEIASAFRINAYIPLPDFSYQKYMKAILKMLVSEQYGIESAMKAFSNEVYNITEIYLREIHELKKRYPDVKLSIIHSRSYDKRKIYKEKRKEFINYESHMIKTLTTKNAKKSSILDYITMPALPYYLDGITEIIQVDCIDETDSYRKCQKLHKNAVTIYPFLYPEALSGDGENTIYYSKREYKKYRKEIGLT